MIDILLDFLPCLVICRLVSFSLISSLLYLSSELNIFITTEQTSLLVHMYLEAL